MRAPHIYGRDLYLGLLHGNFLRLDDIDTRRFIEALETKALETSSRDIGYLLRCGAWRDQLVGAWFAGYLRDDDHFSTIAERLLASRTCYFGQGLCFAMARFETAGASQALQEYLDKFLPVGEREYDQEWAIGALSWLDRRRSTTYAPGYLAPEFWKIGTGDVHLGDLKPEDGIQRFAAIMQAVAQYEAI